MKCFKQISESDAILVLNCDKNGITGYRNFNFNGNWTSLFLKKKIFYLIDCLILIKKDGFMKLELHSQ